jgi:murein L,D-transpeptidase YcbB/YkuD
MGLLVWSACNRTDDTRHIDPIRDVLAAQPDWADDPRERLWEAQRDFYDGRRYLPAWIHGGRPTPQFEDLLRQLHASARHGLEPSRYGVETLEQALAEAQTRFSGSRFPPERIAELDLRLTYAYLRYAADLLGWGTTSRDIDRNWLSAPDEVDLAAWLERAVQAGAIEDSLEALTPVHPQYLGLQAALAVERQNRGDGVEQLRLNLERWRWMPRDLGDRYVLVNVPSYQLHVMEGDRSVLDMRVIVGDPETPTPIFSDRMTYLVFSPYWNIPDSILRKETLPRAVQDPEYLIRNDIEVVRDGQVVDPAAIDWEDEARMEGLRFRQAPGPENALGLVKFIFPNHFQVYLHDTPDGRLFSRERRTLSHGCVRVEQPVALAQYVLRDEMEWTEQRIHSAMHAHQEQVVTLAEPLPVHIGYWTAWVGPDGTVMYLDDPYGFDARHAEVRRR